MKVTLFKDMQAENWPSMDRYARSLADHLSILTSPRGGQFSIFSSEPPIKSSRIKLFWRRSVYPFLARFRRSDVNHVLDHSYAHLLEVLDPQKTVITCHDLIPLEYEKDEATLTSFKETVSHLGKAAVVLADSEETKRDLKEKLSIPEDKIKVIYLGVDPIFRPIRDTSRLEKVKQKFGLPQGKMVMSLGNSLSYKNVEGILRSFHKVLQNFPDVCLLRVGRLTNEQHQLLDFLDLRDHYLEIKNPSDEDLVGLYNWASVFVSPSFKEGFGLPVLEALACGIPVVISPGTSLEEIAGEAGIYVNPKNIDEMARAVLSVIREPLSERRGDSLVKRALLFSWQQTAKQTLSVYETVIKGENI